MMKRIVETGWVYFAHAYKTYGKDRAAGSRAWNRVNMDHPTMARVEDGVKYVHIDALREMWGDIPELAEYEVDTEAVSLTINMCETGQKCRTKLGEESNIYIRRLTRALEKDDLRQFYNTVIEICNISRVSVPIELLTNVRVDYRLQYGFIAGLV